MWLSAPTPLPLDLGIGHPSLAALGNALAGRQYAEARCDEDRLHGSNEKLFSRMEEHSLVWICKLEAIAM